MAGTKEQIFTTALDLFAKGSYHAVSIRDIAQAVGIKPASIYNHYPSKDAILEAIYAYYDQNMAELMPDLDGLLAQVGRVHPHTILKATNFEYPRKLWSPWQRPCWSRRP